MTERRMRPLRVLQFGEGVFLRAFADWMIDVANEAGVFDGDVVILKPRAGKVSDAFKEQECLYTVALRGKADGEIVDARRRITCVRDCISTHEEPEIFAALAREPELRFCISNTTEAGITLDLSDREDTIPATFPGKAAKFLYLRWKHFAGAADKGLIFLPTELIEENGTRLRECVLALSENWGYPADFLAWVRENCVFANTLVDRIVTGKPEEELVPYRDELLDAAEPFALWVIESERDISGEFPLHRAGLPVVFCRDLTPYRERKVRTLNGAHTSSVLLGWLLGCETVGDCLRDAEMRAFMERAVFGDIVPYVPLPRAEAEDFARSVFERFENPFLRHSVLAISLNSVSKWRARVLPSLRDAYAAGAVPAALVFSFAALLAFYTAEEDGAAVTADGRTYTVRDDAAALAFFAENSRLQEAEYVRKTAEKLDFWGEDLRKYPGFVELAGKYLADIRTRGARAALQTLLEDVR